MISLIRARQSSKKIDETQEPFLLHQHCKTEEQHLHSHSDHLTSLKIAAQGFYTPLHSPPSSPPPPPLLNTSVRSIGSPYSEVTPSDSDNDGDIEMDDEDDFTAAKLPPLPPLKLVRPRSYASTTNDTKPYQIHTLTRSTLSQKPPNPPLKILLALTPHPASLAENIFFPSLSTRFCADFSAKNEKWACVSLYAHLRGWMERHRDSTGKSGQEREDDEGEYEVGIGSIHPYALRDKLARECGVQWRLGVPILLKLIERGVKRGLRNFVVCGLELGDLEGIRAFGEIIAEPEGILAFLPILEVDKTVPRGYESRTVEIRSTEPPLIYDTLLAALYAKGTASTSGDVNEPILIED